MIDQLKEQIEQLAKSTQQAKANAHSEIEKLTDPKQKAFFLDILARAEKGEFNAESFINESLKF